YTQFLLHLDHCCMPVPRLRPTRRGGWVATTGQHPVIACEFEAGRSPGFLPLHRVVQVGGILGRLHQLQGLECPLPETLRLTPEEQGVLSSLPGALGTWARGTWERVGHVRHLPTALVPVHADLFPDNLIVRRQRIVVLDWEDGSLDLPQI